jgi:hypothetical protein
VSLFPSGNVLTYMCGCMYIHIYIYMYICTSYIYIYWCKYWYKYVYILTHMVKSFKVTPLLVLSIDINNAFIKSSDTYISYSWRKSFNCVTLNLPIPSWSISLYQLLRSFSLPRAPPVGPIYMRMYICNYIYNDIWIYTYLYICMYVYAYTHIYLYVYTVYTHTSLYTHILARPSRPEDI